MLTAGTITATSSALGADGRLRPLRLPAAGARLVRFVAIGGASTVLYWALFWLARPLMAASWASLLALVASTLANTAAQRRFTFATAGDPRTARRDHLLSLAAFGGSWLLSIAALGWLATLAPSASALSELAVAQACTLAGSATRFAVLQAWSRHG